ncbi:MAG: YggS family pyridoxal phosphate-dependent enzyme [Frankiaceae bacterium]|nr:YggS family pyridoxal phosphate-dependent enzyme [Frankiaceae bacterium]
MTRRAELAANLAALESRVGAACRAAGRDRSEVGVVAVSKTWPASDVVLLRDLGLRDFGENRDADAAQKAAAVPDVRWHFVGSVQTNKARSVASYAHVVHSLDRPSLVTALSAGAVRAGRLVDVLVQVSLDGAPGRGGADPDDVPELAGLAAAADGLRLAGVMAVAPLGAAARPAFDRLAAVAEALRSRHPEARIVSAGMTGDLEDAVAAGANLLRVGTALFGTRPPLLR